MAHTGEGLRSQKLPKKNLVYSTDKYIYIFKYYGWGGKGSDPLKKNYMYATKSIHSLNLV